MDASINYREGDIHLNLNELFNKEKERRNWQDPEGTLKRIGLSECHYFADIGCGYGFFSIPAAKIVGEKGKIYAVDKNPEAISIVKKRLNKESLNAELVTGMAEETLFCEKCMDIVFFSIVLHDFADIPKVLENSRKMIKNDGTLVNIDWKKIHLDKGPPYSKKFSVEKAKSLIKNAGFNVKDVRNDSELLYTIIADPA
ncbi:methyltransferase domain-containing protein [Candidatus Bathyarchaeota archaeon]|nr:methyltransferase domain-containing protein [Candidatus Bathyarchaeota archaeon]